MRCLTNCSRLLRGFYEDKHMPIPDIVLCFIEETEQNDTSPTSSDNEDEQQSSSQAGDQDQDLSQTHVDHDHESDDDS